MSTSFLHGFIKIIKIMKKIPIEHQFVVYVTGLSSNALYSYSTLQTDTIKIDKKYSFTQNGYTQFMIIDKNNKHYNINNSFWYWKWNSIEDWNILRENDSIKVKYYGYRIPILGFFPNIVCSKNGLSENNTDGFILTQNQSYVYK